MAEKSSFGFSELAKEASMQPKEALLEIKQSNKSLYIGIPKEITLQEHRIPLTPSSVTQLVNNGHEVWIETGAGLVAKFTDKDYSEAGAQICQSRDEVYKANIIVKVEPPTEEEVKLLGHDPIAPSAGMSARWRRVSPSSLAQDAFDGGDHTRRWFVLFRTGNGRFVYSVS